MRILRYVAACAVLVTACAAPPPPSPSPSPDPPPAAILVQAGDVGHESLTIVDLSTTAMTPVELPAGGVHVIAAGWAPRIVAAQRQPSVAVGTPVGSSVAWEIVDLRAVGVAGDIVGGALSPDSSRLVVALSAADPRRPYHVVTVDLASRLATPVLVDAEIDGRPVWIDDRRVAVPSIGRGHRRMLVIVDVENGEQREQPTELADLTRSADGRRFATAAAIYDSTIFELADPVSATIARTRVPSNHGSVALDPSGTRLAVVLSDDSGDALAIAIHAEALGWNEAARFAIPGGAKRAFMTWLR